MGLRVNTSISSMNAQRNLGRWIAGLRASYRSLSAGLRITATPNVRSSLSPGGDLRHRLRSLDSAQRDARDGIALVQAVQSALDAFPSPLLRRRSPAADARPKSDPAAASIPGVWIADEEGPTATAAHGGQS